ncbi:MAG: RDD family protein, partial [Myxococcaceae bacterium]|nr:RDD family protein [Myxococcaceae bacterium]
AVGVVSFVAFVYTTLFAFLWRGRTPGRLLLGIHLVDATGQAPHAGRALVRAALSLASFGLFLSGFWLALFDRKGQTLHDKLTSTFVVRLKPAH